MRARMRARAQGHRSWVLAVAWSPDAKILASGDMDGAINLWDPETGRLLGGCSGHKKWITSLVRGRLGGRRGERGVERRERGEREAARREGSAPAERRAAGRQMRPSDNHKPQPPPLTDPNQIPRPNQNRRRGSRRTGRCPRVASSAAART